VRTASANAARASRKLGEPPQRELENAASLTGANHVDVEARERAGMMLGERLAQGRAAPNAQQQVGDDRLDALVGRQLLEDRQRAVEGQARLEERGELLRERQEILAADARGAARDSHRPRSAWGATRIGK